ncbi:hypothetical protein [Thalassotalea fusca]
MSSLSSSKVERFIEFTESASGLFTIGCIVAMFFLFYANHYSIGTIAPGIYYFGVIVPTSLFFWSTAKQSNYKLKVGKAIVGVAFVVWAITDAIMRHS